MIKRISSSPPSFYFRDSTGERTYNKGIKMSIILLLSAIQWMWNHRLLRRSWIFFFFSQRNSNTKNYFRLPNFHSFTVGIRTITIIRNKISLQNLSFLERVSFFPPLSILQFFPPETIIPFLPLDLHFLSSFFSSSPARFHSPYLILEID